MKLFSPRRRHTRREQPRFSNIPAAAPLRLAALFLLLASAAKAGMLDVEKDEVTLGFIKLTDCVPLVIAKEKGYFDDEGVSVKVEAQANWKILLDRVISGELDGAHMLAGQPIGATIGVGTKADVITAVSLDLNGNAITVSKAIWEMMKEADKQLAAPKPPHPISAASLKIVADKMKAEGETLKFGMVFPVSTHNYELRYWLAAGGIHPGLYTATDVTGTTGADALLSVTPPPQMPATMEQGTIHGYCVGEPWNEQAVLRGIGVVVATDEQIWKNNPEKVFGVLQSWDKKYPNTHLALVKAIIRACKWLDETPANRLEAVKILSRPEYVGADENVIAASMTGTFEFQKGDKRPMPGFNIFFKDYATYPYASDCIWFLTQMRRWGQIAEPKPDAWYHETAKKIYRADLYKKAAESLIDDGHLQKTDIPKTDGYRTAGGHFIDNMKYDGKKPLEYLAGFKIGNTK